MAGVTASLPPGHYDAWIQGSFATGVRLFVDGTGYGDGVRRPRPAVRLASARPGRRPTTAPPHVALISLDKPWWQSGSKRPDFAGRLVFVRRGGPSRTITVPPERARTLCGRRLDWIELPA